MFWQPLILTLTLHHPAPPTITVRLSEWKVEVSQPTVPPGTVTFVARNVGTIPHAFEVEGRGVERETAQIQPGDSAVLTVTLRAGEYEVYCPIGEGSHEKLGMKAELYVGAAKPEEEHSAGKGASATKVIRVRGGGPVIQILPGPFPFPDSVASVIPRFGAESTALRKQEANGPYSDSVARVTGTFRLTAWDRGAARDSVDGVARFTTQDGAAWRLELFGVQTRDVPHHPRFGGVIMGLYYHGNTEVHTPLVPTIMSRVALWTYGRLYRDGKEVTDSAQVHVMLLSRTRRLSDFGLQCWNCSREPEEELQLQVTPAAGGEALPAPGGVLFLNWEKSVGSPG